MRTRRIKEDVEGYYHVVGRCCRQLFLLDDKAKDFFVNVMRRVEGFSGVEVLSYCVLDDHFHMLVHVPEKVDVGEEELLKRIETLESKDKATETKARWKMLRKDGHGADVEKELGRLRNRLCDVSCFTSNLKQRVSVWYDQQHGYAGTMWEGRFGCTVVEGTSRTLSAVSAYIDLNPVRAAIVKDPKNYRWSSYGAAMAGDAKALRGLARIYDDAAVGGDFRGKYAADYRGKLYVGKDDAMDPAEIEKVIEERGELPLPVLLRCKVRYFTKSTFLGSKEFVNAEFEKHRYAFGPKRKDGARIIGICKDWDGARLYSARMLQVAPVSIPQAKSAAARRLPTSP